MTSHVTRRMQCIVGERERPNLSCWVCKKHIKKPSGHVKERFDPKAIFVGLRRRIGRSTLGLYTRVQYNTATLELYDVSAYPSNQRTKTKT